MFSLAIVSNLICFLVIAFGQRETVALHHELHPANVNGIFLIGVHELSLKLDGINESHRTKRSGSSGISTSSIYVKSKITSRFAQTDFKSVMKNSNDEDLEARFIVYLPDSAFISNFSMIIDNQTHVGIVMEKEAADKEYEAARERNETAGQVSNISPPDKKRNTEIFLVQVNIAANKGVTFNLEYQQLLERELGFMKHVISIRPDSPVEHIAIVVDIYEPEGINILEISEPGSNDITLQHSHVDHVSDKVKSIVYQPDQMDIEGDFVVMYDTFHEGNDAGNVVVDNGYFVHYFSPNELEPLPKDVVFVIDISGSMSGDKIEQTRDSMFIILDKLRPEDFFQMIFFNDDVVLWQSNEVYQASEKNIEAAKKHIIDYLNAGGSTNINDALVSACNFLKQRKNDHLKYIYFLTDGEATAGVTDNELIVSNVVEAASEQVIVFSLGFGFSLNFELLQKISYRTQGYAKRIYVDVDATEQMELFFLGINTPLLLNVKMSYPYEVILIDTLTKTSFNQYFNGTELIVAGKMNQDREKDIVEITVEAMTNEIVKYSKEINLADIDSIPKNTMSFYPSGFTEKLWAYKTIKDILEKELRTDDPEDKQALRDYGLQLALKYNLVTPMTSMVVTQSQSDDRNIGVGLDDISMASGVAISSRSNASTIHAQIGVIWGVICWFTIILF